MSNASKEYTSNQASVKKRMLSKQMPTESLTAESWKAFVDFAQLQAGGVPLKELQQRLESWTNPKKR